MALIKIKFASRDAMIAMYQPNPLRAIATLIKTGGYSEESKLFEVNGDSQDAAEEAFDLTNNPWRQEEREEKYGRGRSLSVGDIVVVGDEQWLCSSFGWEEI